MSGRTAEGLLPAEAGYGELVAIVADPVLEHPPGRRWLYALLAATVVTLGCVGTRFCQANCPWKVRHFNFFGYADGQGYANQDAPSLTAQRNPDVTVRARGVMEKCTYCVQRISATRRTAEKERRAIAEGEVVTACQAACPTTAIRFGDLRRPDSDVSRLRREPQHYALLGHLGTRPRTTYLSDVRNPNPDLEG